MSVKKVILPNLGEVSLYKRKGVRSMRLSISHEGGVRLTLPKWTPYSAGVLFINNNLRWIEAHKAPDAPLISNNMRVGKAHTLIFIEDGAVNKPSTRVSYNQVKVILPIGMAPSSSSAQTAARNAILRALKKEAEQLLPQRLETLARQFGYEYKSVKIKQLKSRWGSCNNLKQITLNFYLMQLPWELIDYVILHELTHTEVLAHGPEFWKQLTKRLPNAKQLKKQVNAYKPVINTNLA